MYRVRLSLSGNKKGESFMLMLSAPEGAYANAALFIALVRKLIDKGVISKEEMSTIVDEAGASLSQGNSVAMRHALQTLHWLRQGRKSDNGRRLGANL